MDNISKAKSFYKKYQIPVNCFILFGLLFVSLWMPYINILSILLCCVFIALDLDNGLCYLGFLFPFKNIYQLMGVDLLTVNIALYFALIFIRFCREKRFKDKQTIFIIICAIAFLIYCVLPRQTFGIWESIRVAVILAILIIGFIFKDSIKFKNFLVVFFTAVMISSLIGLLRGHVLRLDELVDSFFPVGKFNRFCGLELDPNYYGSLLIISFSGMLYLHLNNEINKYIIPVCLGAIVQFGIMTLSKSFIIALAILMVLWVIDIIVKPTKDKLICFGTSVFIVAAMCLVNAERLKVLWGRFSILVDDSNYGDGYEASGSIVESMTTGRTGIWKMYLQYFMDNPIRFIFGTGTSSTGRSILARESHNTLIQIIYKIGLIGLLVYLGVFIVLTIYYVKKGKFKFYYIIPLIMLVAECMFLDYFSMLTFAFLLIIALAPITRDGETIKKEVNKIDGRIEESKSVDNSSGV